MIGRDIFFLRFLLAFFFGMTASAAAPEVPDWPAELALVFPEASQPHRLSITIYLADQRLRAIWQQTFATLFRFVDLDADGQLNEREIQSLPNAFQLRQIGWRGPHPWSSQQLTLAKLDTNQDHRVDLKELSHFYQQSAGFGSALVALGIAPHTEALHQLLWQQIDHNHDNRLTRTEFEQASRLMQLDKDGDLLIRPQELIPNISYPGTACTHLLDSATSKTMELPFYVDLHPTQIRSATGCEPTIQQPSVLVGPAPDQHYRAMGCEPTTQQPSPVVDCVVTFQALEPFQAKVEQNSPIATATSNPGELSFNLPKLSYEGRPRIGKLFPLLKTARQSYHDRWQAADLDRSGALDDKERAGPANIELERVFQVADRNQNNLLELAEVNQWLDLQTQIGQGMVWVSILYFGRGLFEVLDTNRSGSLSTLELQSAWQTLDQAGYCDEAHCAPERLPVYLQLTFSHGLPNSPWEPKPTSAPQWFVGMDRNRDGVLTPAEFLGSRAHFQQLDANHDGQLTQNEIKPDTDSN